MPYFAPFSPTETNTSIQLQSPSTIHWFGTDFLGRDVLSRFLHGGQHTLFVAIVSTIFAAILGIVFGVLIGSAKRLGYLVSMPINAILSFPNLLLALAILTLLGSGDGSLIVAVGIAQLASYSKVIQAATLELRSMGYVEASQSMGASSRWVIFNHILPNIQPTIFAYTGITFSYCILNSAALSFLGLGIEPGLPDWGVMLAEGRMVFRDAPWVAFPAGLAITLLVWLANRPVIKSPWS